MGTLLTGAPATVQAQVRTEVEATVSVEFEAWGKLQLALASGSQQMNLLATAPGAAANGSGGTAAAAVALVLDGSTSATQLNVGAAAASFPAGTLVAVDVDYTGQVGYVGSGISAAYVKSSAAVGDDAKLHPAADAERGVGRRRQRRVSGNLLLLASRLPAGVPSAGMQVSALTGFVDREGGSFFQEWSGLFVMEGEQGDRVVFHYPRLQAMQGSAEAVETLAAPLERARLAGVFRALPVVDANDGETVLCFRSYLPGAMRSV